MLVGTRFREHISEAKVIMKKAKKGDNYIGHRLLNI